MKPSRGNKLRRLVDGANDGSVDPGDAMSQSISGVILCGGRSTRMHRPKALLPWNGQPLIVSLVSRMREIFTDVVVVSSNELRLPPLAARIVVDRTADLGPLGGIREGLYAVQGESAVITSTDAPNLQIALIEALLEAGPTAAFEVAGRVEPFPALYGRHLRSTADTLLSSGQRRPLHLLEAAGFHGLDGSTWAAMGAFDNINTPAEYLHATTTTNSAGTVTIELTGTIQEAVGQPEVITPVGTLRQVLRALEPQLQLVQRDAISRRVHVSLNGTQRVEDLAMPLGPGERLRVDEAIDKGQRP
jgi:molybdopterin-guanine dinucleotide biosynthesis protein A